MFGYTIIKTEILEQFKADLEKAVENTKKLEAELAELAIINIKKLKTKNEEITKEYETIYHTLRDLQEVVKDAPTLKHSKLKLRDRDLLRTFFPYDPWISRLRKAAKLKET